MPIEVALKPKQEPKSLTTFGTLVPLRVVAFDVVSQDLARDLERAVKLNDIIFLLPSPYGSISAVLNASQGHTIDLKLVGKIKCLRSFSVKSITIYKDENDTYQEP